MGVTEPQQRRSEATLAKILAACDALAEQRGFDELSMQDIAKTAGVSVGNLYNRFSDKEGLIQHLIRRRQVEVGQRITGMLEKPPSELDLSARLSAITRGLREGTADLRPLLVSAARRVSGGNEIDAEVRGGGETLVEELALWLQADDAGLDFERCRFAVANIAYALQFDAIFGAPARMFGDALEPRLIAQARAYLLSEETAA